MSDTEVIIHLLRDVEWRLRAKRLLDELALGLSIVLGFLIVLKAWDLFSPLRSTTITFAIAACAFLFAGYVGWRLRKRGTLDQAAISIDRKAGLKDEIKTAFWFIRNPRSSEWVDRQIQRAARKAGTIDVPGAYPGIIPRSSYIATAMIVVFLALNFAPLPLNHNWLMLQAGPATLAEKNERADKHIDVDPKIIRAVLEQIAKDFERSERLRGVAQALMDKQLDVAAAELRKLGAQLGTESPESIEEIQESLQDAAGNSRPGLEALTEDLVEMASALRNKDVTAAQAATEEIAEDFEGLDEEIYKQESTLDQLAPGNERRAEQDGHVAGAPIPETRDFPQSTTSTDGVGASGGRAEAGPREGRPTTLAVKLQQEALKGALSPGTIRVDVEEASRRERSKLDYRNIKSELTAAQKDALNQENMPWRYRPLIKNYFQAILDPVKSR